MVRVTRSSIIALFRGNGDVIEPDGQVGVLIRRRARRRAHHPGQRVDHEHDRHQHDAEADGQRKGCPSTSEAIAVVMVRV